MARQAYIFYLIKTNTVLPFLIEKHFISYINANPGEIKECLEYSNILMKSKQKSFRISFFFGNIASFRILK